MNAAAMLDQAIERRRRDDVDAALDTLDQLVDEQMGEIAPLDAKRIEAIDVRDLRAELLNELETLRIALNEVLR